MRVEGKLVVLRTKRPQDSEADYAWRTDPELAALDATTPLAVTFREYERYYREVNFYYPKRLRHVRNLYGKARKRLEKILPTMGRNTIVVRSAYLFGDELFADVYERGLEEFYERLYPAGGAVAGFAVVADSFQDGGFGAEATEAYGRALAAAKRELARLTKSQGAGSEGVRALETQKRTIEKGREKALALP